MTTEKVDSLETIERTGGLKLRRTRFVFLVQDALRQFRTPSIEEAWLKAWAWILTEEQMAAMVRMPVKRDLDETNTMLADWAEQIGNLTPPRIDRIEEDLLDEHSEDRPEK
jgi:hypothetical protein